MGHILRRAVESAWHGARTEASTVVTDVAAFGEETHAYPAQAGL